MGIKPFQDPDEIVRVWMEYQKNGDQILRERREQRQKTIWFRMPTHRLPYRVRKDAG